MEQTFLGIDLGTSAMKLVLIDGHKRVLAQLTEEYSIAQPERGFNEINPEVWYECMMKAVERILIGQDKRRVSGIGVTGQMHTLIILDQNGNPVRPAIMWNDIRTRNLIPALKERICKFPGGEYLAKTISTGSPAANLYWIRKNEPENFKRIRKFLIGPDYLVYRLTGHCGTDYCEASTSCLYQIETKKWSAEIRELIGLEEDVYPEVRGSAVPAGILMSSIADKLGLKQGIPVLTGTGDNPATAISTGCLGKGYPVISLGTSGIFMTPVEKFRPDVRGKTILFAFDELNVSYLVQGAVQSNGSTFDWWFRRILKEDFSKIDHLINITHSQDSGVLFYPHLMGDKTLYGDPDLRGAFIGLSMETDRSDMLYAVIEGLCFSFRELAEKMDLPLQQFESIKVVGGGTRNRAWLQTMANVLNIRIEQMDGNVGPAFGIALLAAYQGGCFESLEQISEGFVQIQECFDPQPDRVEICESHYKKYLRIRKGLKYIMDGEEIG